MDSKASVKWGDVLKLFYPIGKLWISTDSTYPGDIVGGTWQPIPADTFIASVGLKAAGQTGGNNNAVVVSHNHSGAVNTANGSFEAMNHTDNVTGFVTYERLSSGPSGTLGNAGRYTLNHSHGLTINSFGETGVNKNMPKYLACYIWQRTA